MIDKYFKACNLCGGSVIYTSNAVIYGREYGSGTYIKGSNKGNGYSSFCVTGCPLYIAPSEKRLAEQARQDREDAEERRREQDRRRGRLFF